MLKGISPIISPDLLAVLCRMGHGDEIVLADAHFPANRYNENVLRADGTTILRLLEAIMPLFELDDYVDAPLAMMDLVPGDTMDPEIEASYRVPISKHAGDVTIERVERFAFYERTRSAFAVVMTGATPKYGNIILRKGVIPD